MLEQSFTKVYMKFKLHFYQKAFEKLKEREASLTAVETFCMEIIYALGNPTVAEFSKAANISSPNATYKINNLVAKGYVKRVRSEEDKRESHLVVTEKYHEYYNMSNRYMHEVMERMESRFTKEELAVVNRVLEVMSEELMPEVELKR
ncbi:MAG: MarR family transcriptional regulator [Lachnospiraceae bacterium]|nr:MarR family transcriptional regulator [Lachnospiraceae bacterium]